MKKAIALLLSFLIVLSGCKITYTDSSEPSGTTGKTDAESDGNASAEGGNTDETKTQDPLSLIRNSLLQKCSFQTDEMYMNLARFGFSRTMRQEAATDGSFHFVVEFCQWDYGSDYDQKTLTEFYYQYEDGVLACYMKEDENETTRTTLSKAEEREMDASREQILGAFSLLPKYLTDFSDLGVSSDSGLHEYSFKLALSDVITDQTLLSSYIANVFAASGFDYKKENEHVIYITATISVDDSMRPVTLRHDFSELKPFVLNEGALSGEYALDTNLMYLNYEFDYDMVPSIPVPEGF